MSKSNTQTACNKKSVIVRMKNLPLCCPSNDMQLWNAHPKVYLPIEQTGTEVCPYCGTRYTLKND